MRYFQAFLFVALIGLLAGAGRATEPEPQASIDPAPFGKLPVMFNGRVINFDALARNILLEISGLETWPDLQGKPQAAVTLLLELMAGDPQVVLKSRVVKLEHPEVRKLLDLKPGAATEKGRPGPGPFHFTMAQVLANSEPLQQRCREILQRTRRPTPDEEAMLSADDRLRDFYRMLSVFESPDLSDRDTAAASISRAKRVEQESIPFIVAPAKRGEEWKTLTYAMILDRVEGEQAAKTHPGAAHFARMVSAYRQRDAKNWAQSLQAYSAHIAAEKLATAPYGFTLPAGWSETGIPRLTSQSYFSDARAYGTTVTTVKRPSDRGDMILHVNFFPGPTADREQIINSWRWDESLEPLTAAEIKTQDIKISGGTGWKTELDSPRGMPGRAERLMGFGVTLHGQNWIICASGAPALMAAEAPAIEQFVKSIAVGGADEINAWFRLPPAETLEIPAGTKAVQVIVPAGERIWLLHALYWADGQPEASLEQLRALVKSIQFKQDMRTADELLGQVPFDWKLPAAWTLLPGKIDLQVATKDSAADDPESLMLTLKPLQRTGQQPVTAASTLPLINQGRAAYRLPDLTAEAFQKIAKEGDKTRRVTFEVLKVDGREFYFVVSDYPDSQK